MSQLICTRTRRGKYPTLPWEPLSLEPLVTWRKTPDALVRSAGH